MPRARGAARCADLTGNCAPMTGWICGHCGAPRRVWTPSSPRPRHARYAASLIAGLAPAVESNTTTARPCAPARKQYVGDLVVGPGLQEKSAQHLLPVGLLIANIDQGVGIERHKHGTQGTDHGKAMRSASTTRCYSTLLPLGSRVLCRAFADVSVLEGGLNNQQRE